MQVGLCGTIQFADNPHAFVGITGEARSGQMLGAVKFGVSAQSACSAYRTFLLGPLSLRQTFDPGQDFGTRYIRGTHMISLYNDILVGRMFERQINPEGTKGIQRVLRTNNPQYRHRFFKARNCRLHMT